MAIYHFSAQTISRSQGRSAVGCSAYRSAAELFDERYGKTHDYTGKQDVVYSEIMLPQDTLSWMGDREKLWNAVEANEKRKDAQLAREIQVSLPRELTLPQNIELIKEFVQKEFVDKGMIADVAVHLDKSSDGDLQPHAHVMLTMREITLDGFGQKVREWNSKEHLLMWRENWAEVTNRHLALNGHDLIIDHRSNFERGINLEPQHKIGTSASRHQLDRLADHQRIAFENGEKIYRNPKLALDALTQERSTFTHQDLARYINRHTKDAEQFERVYEKVKISEQILSLGFDQNGRERFTTIDMLDIENKMIRRTQELTNLGNHHVGPSSFLHGLTKRTLSNEQESAYLYLLETGDLKCLIGYAGTGKSYLLGAVKDAWECEGYRVIGATLAGIAAENLMASSGIESRTIASRMYYWERGEQLLNSRDILVIDEAGMLGSRQMEQLLKYVQAAQAKAVLIGDPHQLQAIEAGAAFRAIVERTGFVELNEIRRQEHEWQRDATKKFARGNVESGIISYKVHEHIHEFETQAVAKKAMVELWNDARITDNENTQIMLSYTRKDAQELNHIARDLRQKLGELGEAHVLQTSKGYKKFAENDRIYFLKNDRQIGVKNGSLGTIEKIDNNLLTIKVDRADTQSLEDSKVTIDLDKYNHIDYGYAATIHKAQGATVDRCYLLASKHMDRHATYVGMTRHRESADLFWSREEFSNERSLHDTLGRERAKDVTLDYSHQQICDNFATHRNIKISEPLANEIKNTLSEKEISQEFHKEKGFVAEKIKDSDFTKMYIQGLRKDIDELVGLNKYHENENLEVNKESPDKTLSEFEKRAILVEKAVRNLYSQTKQDPQNLEAKNELKDLLKKVSGDKQLMEDLKERAPALTQRIKALTKEKSLSRGLRMRL